jgi:hypothetical protein
MMTGLTNQNLEGVEGRWMDYWLFVESWQSTLFSILRVICHHPLFSVWSRTDRETVHVHRTDIHWCTGTLRTYDLSYQLPVPGTDSSHYLPRYLVPVPGIVDRLNAWVGVSLV